MSKILPETMGTAYEDATIRNVLDMNVASDFIEIILAKLRFLKITDPLQDGMYFQMIT